MSFITAVSSQGCSTQAGIDDITPAQFKVLFDSPIEIQNVDLELNSCKVSKLNRINIITNRNVIVFRLGDACDQYRAVVPPGNYTALDLATAIASAMNDVAPTNNYRGFSGSLSGANAIQITYSLLVVPNASVFAGVADNRVSEGPEQNIESANAASDFVTFTYPNSQQQNNVSNFKRPNDTFEFCGPLDVGQHLDNGFGQDDNTRTTFIDYGIWEEARGPNTGRFQAIVQPVSCVTNSNFERGFGGLTGGFAGNSYFTFEIEPTRYDDGTEVPVSDLFHFGTLFSKSTLKNNIPRKVTGKNALQINGVMNKVIADAINDGRGVPYSAYKQFFFPTSVNSATNRILTYETNWSGQLVIKAKQGRPSLTEPFPDGYTFQMDDSTGSSARKQAHSKVKQFGKQFERIRIRPSRKTLMTGLMQQTGLNADSVHDTNCSVFKEVGSGASGIKYKLNSVGQVNFKNTSVLDNNIQNLTPGSSSEFVYTYYKIILIDSAGNPTRVRLTDGGEHVIEYDPTSEDTKIKTIMFLNDPDTFDVIDPAFDTSTFTNMLSNFHFIKVAAGDISEDVNAGNITTQFASRIPSFNMGLMANNIFLNNDVGSYDSTAVSSSNDLRRDITNKGNFNPLHVPKNYEIDIGTNFAKDATNALKVNIYQYQPSNVLDEFISQDNRFNDVKKTLFNGFSSTWNSLAGDGPAMAAWTTFDATNPDHAVRITFKTLDVYTYEILCAYTTNFTGVDSATFIEERTLTLTGVTRGGGVNIFKNEALLKVRDFPLQPVFSAGTCSIKEDATAFTRTHITSRGSVYGDSNFNKNLANRIVGTNETNLVDYIVPQNSGPALSPDGQKPVIMIKSAPLILSQIDNTPPVAVPSFGNCNPQDFDPNANLMSVGLHDIMYSQMGGGANTFNFQTHQPASSLVYLPSFVVEINLPVKSYIGKNYTLGKVEDVVGSGIKSQIVGVCPGTKFEDTTAIVADYTYKMEYSKPVQIRLPTKTTFYSLDITLRSILDGKILKDLVHSTEVVLRMYDLTK